MEELSWMKAESRLRSGSDFYFRLFVALSWRLVWNSSKGGNLGWLLGGCLQVVAGPLDSPAFEVR